MDAPRLELEAFLTGKQVTVARKLEPRDLDDLLRILPRRYVVPGPLRAISTLHEGEDVSVIATVQDARHRRMRTRAGSILEAVISDGTDSLALTFFLAKDHLVAWHEGRLRPGRRILVKGVVSHQRSGRRSDHGDGAQIVHPAYELIDEEGISLEDAMAPRPIYPLRKKASQAAMQDVFRTAVEHADLLVPAIPDRIRRTEDLLPLAEALRRLHLPRRPEDPEQGRATLLFEEALILQTIFAQRRARDAHTPAPPLPGGGRLAALLDGRLPFDLTPGQIEVGEELGEHLSRSYPTNVLLQGEVGSGKTVVALRAMVRAVDAGHQAVLLAPTEVLAEQHHRSIETLLGELGRAGRLDGHPEATSVRLLTGSSSTAERRRTMLDITSGAAGIVIGTHALLHEQVEFASLALVIIDEQQRFGVDHRRRLRAKGPEGGSPHVIVMTATPIPRTKALAEFGDLDVLSLRDVPPGRPGITSYEVPEILERWERRMWHRAAEEIEAGRQVFVVCPHIDEDEQEPAPPPPDLWDGDRREEDLGFPDFPPRGVHQVAERLRRRPELASARIGVLHGRLGAEEKQQAMQAFLDRELDILVSTTVIEVGVDVPNASVMIVLDAEHFGVSQLHQLRGRVGRGMHPGIAFFATRADPGSPRTAHLQQVARTQDGFALAELDLRHRGSGDLIGDEQSGLGRTMRYLRLSQHAELIDHARQIALEIIAVDPQLDHDPGLARAIAQRLAEADPDVERS
ncbi:ATP-dependent DNA helicase RecG [Brachybacterium hainanense]|uniref:Probable DNA 3'-5' helicase RecG n=1 Tax=Brachybacterium hainanense TaxID=1541174 RepID=A0ABV6R8L3_9MICO